MTVSRSRRMVVAGLVLVVTGVVLLAFVGWQLYGTTWVSERRQAELVEQTESTWRARGDQGGEGGRGVEVDEGTVEALVRIPDFGEGYVMPVLQGVEDDALAAGLGRIPGSVGPGERGNYALAGHRVTHGEPLRDLPDLEVGARILVETSDTVFTYQLVTAGDALTVPFTAGWVLDPRPTNPDEEGVQPPQEQGQRLLTLTTCADIFHTDDRLVAFAVLVDTDRSS